MTDRKIVPIDKFALLDAYDREHEGEPGRERQLIQDAVVLECEPVRYAEWIPKEMMSKHLYARNYYCSECKFEPIECGSYCPKCGAHTRIHINREEGLKKTKIISAFPCTGKSTLAKENLDFKILDLDSSEFSHLTFDDGERVLHPGFPVNYINAIKDNIGIYDFILVSTHIEVRKALEENGLKFMVIFPLLNSKQAYIQRMKDRGDNDIFIENITSRWSTFHYNIWKETHNGQNLFLIPYENKYLSDYIYDLANRMETTGNYNEKQKEQ